MSSAAAPLASTPEAAPAAAATLAPSARAAARCENCGAPVPERYCGVCGQRLEPPVHSLWHFMRVATEDLTHADSRLWRTLGALLFRPGFLTAEFLAGHRARYLPPLRLYLVISVVFFLWATATNPNPPVIEIRTSARSAAVVPLDQEVAKLSAPAAVAPGTPEQRGCRDLIYHGPFAARMQPLAMNACRRIAEDQGRSLRDAMAHNLPRAMFLFLPLLAAPMMLMYWRPRHYYVEHLLLLVHYHAFVFLLLLVGWTLGTMLPSVLGFWVRLAVGLYIPWYLYRSMRRVYGQGRLRTGVKLVFLSFCYLVSATLMLALTGLYSALTL